MTGGCERGVVKTCQVFSDGDTLPSLARITDVRLPARAKNLTGLVRLWRVIIFLAVITHPNPYLKGGA
jgi:hypothetical protein